LGHRNALLRGTSKRCAFYHINFDDGRIMLSDPNGRVASCVDSLLKFMDDCADENCTIVLDEVESVVRHILTGGTISASDRTAILDKFALLLKSCSRIILLDGHLTDATVAYIAGLAPDKAITKYENTFKGALPKVEIFKGSGAPLKASQIEAFKDLILKSERPAVFCDSKDDAIAIYRQLEEIHGEGTGLLLTSDNSAEDLQAEFTDDPKESIKQHQWKFIVATPLLQDGVDISTPNYFSEVFGMFGGVVGVNPVCQMVRRVRHPIGNIKILCAERRYRSPDGTEVYAARLQKLLAERLAAELSEFDPRPTQEILAELCDQLKSCPHHAALFDLQALENFERAHLYDFVCELLRESGHEVLELDLDNPETKKHARVKEEVREDYAEAVASAEIISIAEAEKILSKQGNTKVKESDIRAANRAVIAEQLPGIPITAALVLRLKKERKLLPGMRNLWHFQNPDKAKQLRGYRWEEDKIKVFGSDHRKNYLILRALLKLDLGKVLDCDRTFCKDSPEVLAVAMWGDGKEAKMLGIPLGEQSEIQYLQSLLAYLGVNLVGERKGKERQYSYKPEGGSLPDDFSELYAAVSSKMLEKWEEKVQKKESEKRSAVSAGTLASTALELTHPLPNISIDKVGRGDMDFEEDLEVPICQTEPELPVEFPAAEPPITNLTGWVSRWGKWVAAKVIGWCEYGTRYRVQFEQPSGEVAEMLVFPSSMRMA
ncbi:plasmid replication protein, CyRepA1 family, partial [Microcoleus sp. SVA1_A1]